MAKCLSLVDTNLNGISKSLSALERVEIFGVGSLKDNELIDQLLEKDAKDPAKAFKVIEYLKTLQSFDDLDYRMLVKSGILKKKEALKIEIIFSLVNRSEERR